MRTNFVAPFALFAGLAGICSPLFAHHGSAAYDNSKALVFKDVTVKKVNWGNPHTLVLFDAKDDKGNVVHWVLEGAGASAVNTTGWTKDKVQAGDVVTIYLYRLKSGAPVGRTGKIVLANGTVIGNGALDADRPAQCDQDFGVGGDESVACRPDGRKTTNKE